ncbi:FtsX-like permease family protein [Adlercreutzia sp. ZJ138]|uniref:FtsX-like permease family protein n=1 Tax=Adlercreutzia sp. ZJ138 TaxID=2709405 RepID=UPI0013EC840D|nr:ABC transporter permease [Adlercreutzia sp. ZJ138]
MYAKLAFGNVRRSLRDFGVYFLTIVLGVAVFYAFNSITGQEAINAFNGSKMRDLLGYIMSGVSVFVAVILAFLIIYADRFLIRRRKREFGIYLTLGMRTYDVLKITACETLLVGATSLACGLALGWAFSQVLMHVTAALFSGTVPGFVTGLSRESLLMTLAVFASIFAIATVANARTIASAHLIDLLHASRMNETIKLRSVSLSLLLFVVACGIIGISYKLLIDNGLLEPSPEFACATALVCVGTGLFFYSLSGFLLRLAQSARGAYFRGLNMFTLRQLNSKVNTTFMSMTVVCMTLFLAITSVCGGIGITNAISSSMERTTSYDATVRTMYGLFTSSTGWVPGELGGCDVYAEAVGYDMTQGLRESLDTIEARGQGGDAEGLVGAAAFDAVVRESAQLDLWVDTGGDGLTFSDIDAIGQHTMADYAGTSISDDYGTYPVNIAKLSEVNRALEMAGKQQISLSSDECYVISDFDTTIDYFRERADAHATITIGERPLVMQGFSDVCLETIPFPSNTGLIVVPDDAIPATAVRMYSILNANCGSTESELVFANLIEQVEECENPNTWPVTMVSDRESVFEQSIGFSGIVAFLAVYIGFILTIACAAILAIQQLSEASDNATRYGLLRKLGASERMLSVSLLVQVGIYFLFPLIVALCHTACALSVVTDVVAVFGHMDIGKIALMTTAAFLGTYGVYFLITYFGAKALAKG